MTDEYNDRQHDVRRTAEVLEVVVNVSDIKFVAGQLNNSHLGKTIAIAGQTALEGVLVAVLHTEGWVVGELKGSPTSTAQFACPALTPVEFVSDLPERN